MAFVRTQSSSLTGLDAGLTSTQTADATAIAAFLRAEAAPLIALSLYVSSANWAATTRPAYSRILPFPLTWIEPPALRAAHAASAAHLGLSSLDTDADASGDDDSNNTYYDGEPGRPTRLTAALQTVPDRIRSSLQHSGRKAQGGSILTPEAKAQIRLDETARACLAVLAEQKGGRPFFLDRAAPTQQQQQQQPTSLDCLAFGYLALMIFPDVPRPFLRDALQRHYPDLDAFVADMRQLCFGQSGQSPAATPPCTNQQLAVASTACSPLWLRTLDGVVHGVPGLSGVSLAWLWRRVRLDDDAERGVSAVQSWLQRLAALSASAVGVTLFVSLVLGYRRLPPFGAPVVVYTRVAQPLVGLGAAGILLDAL